jgi:lipopolysaccharide transport system ATP-binding protein
MSSDIVIKVENLSKCYQIYDRPRDRLKQFVVPCLQNLAKMPVKKYYREFWALKDISFDIKKGETVGILGRNGSGKSTLLQLICGTLSHTSGIVATSGRIAALLELGSGFNPDFSGRENVYLSCALLGLSKEETDSLFDDIVAFADIGDFINQPVKNYSSGMFVRLAFAVNVVSQPDIMVVDEALSVGDMNYQAKCMTALNRIQESGATVLFVSHDVGAVKSLCKQAVYLEKGKIVAAGPASEVAELYVRTMREEMNEDVRKFSRVSTSFLSSIRGTAGSHKGGATCVHGQRCVGKDGSLIVFTRSKEFEQRVSTFRYGSGGGRVTYAELLDVDDNPLKIVAFNQEVKIVIYVETQSARRVSVNFNIRDDKKINIVGCGFAQAGQDFLNTTIGGKYRVEYILRLPLQEGAYSLRVQISTPVLGENSADFLDVVDDAVVFRVSRWDEAIVWSKVHLFPTLTVDHL